MDSSSSPASQASSAPTFTLRRQHSDILKSCAEIERAITAECGDTSADQIVTALRQLTGQLKVHLSMEDRVMYPYLIAHKDRNISDLAKRYQAEMGGLVQDYTAFITLYGQSEAIKHNYDDFTAAVKGVFAALRTRIAREDDELYVMVDKVGL